MFFFSIVAQKTTVNISASLLWRPRKWFEKSCKGNFMFGRMVVRKDVRRSQKVLGEWCVLVLLQHIRCKMRLKCWLSALGTFKGCSLPHWVNCRARSSCLYIIPPTLEHCSKTLIWNIETLILSIDPKQDIHYVLIYLSKSAPLKRLFNYMQFNTLWSSIH